MKYRHLYIFSGCLLASSLLISFGCLLGQFENSTEKFNLILNWFVNIGSILSGLGTVCAAFIGYLALNAWKTQTKGLSNINRLIECQESIAVLCVELMPITASISVDKRKELYKVFERLLINLAVIARTSSCKEELNGIRQSLLFSSYRFRDNGFFWSDDKEKLSVAESRLNKIIENW